MTQNIAPTRVPVHDLIARRWSARRFDPHKPVSEAQLYALLEAAHWAPSCYGDQPWRFVVFDRQYDEEAWQRAQECLLEANRRWACQAPLLILAAASRVFSVNGEPNPWAEYDTGAAMENLSLQATAMGLVARQMGGFDAARVREYFAVPEDYRPLVIIAVGHPLAGEQVADPRQRNPRGQHFFRARWGRALEQFREGQEGELC